MEQPEVKQLFGANFPKTADNRTYHVDTKRGEGKKKIDLFISVANRIITVGDLGRAKMLAETFLDKPIDLSNDGSEKRHIPKVFNHLSSRGFATYTGTYKGTPVTIIGTGMGYSMIDFSIRENSAIIDGSIVMIRIGTCGSIDLNANIGDVVVHDQSVMITRNPDAFRKANQEINVKKEIKIVEKQSSNELSYYRVSLPCKADRQLTDLV
jgi:uridine phosphorylase